MTRAAPSMPTPRQTWDTWHEGPMCDPARPKEEPRKPVTATQDRHWREKRRYAETHARLAAELGREWGR